MPQSEASSSSSEPPVKLACATCIQGHRASSCKHQDGSKGPLLVVKKRGRPPTQCSACREKRFRTGRHSRCCCGSRSKAASAPQEDGLKGAKTGEGPSKGDSSTYSPLSFENLLNPCKCKQNGICICCHSARFDNPVRHEAKPYTDAPLTAMEQRMAKRQIRCCDSRAADSSAEESPPVGVADVKHPTLARPCCGGADAAGPPSQHAEPHHHCAPSVDVLLRAADLSQEYEPMCDCRPSCACRGCYDQPDNTESANAKHARDGGRSSTAAAATDCPSCPACDIRLEGPSGIGSVDQFLASSKSE